MQAAPVPLFQDTEMILKIEWQITAGHHATAEEVPGHPVGCIVVFKGVRNIAVTEDVHEELSVRFEPAGYPLEQCAVVTHVLEHLD